MDCIHSLRLYQIVDVVTPKYFGIFLVIYFSKDDF